MQIDDYHRELRGFVDALLFEFPKNEGVSAYFARRSRHQLAVKQDLLPLLVFTAISQKTPSDAIPLAASWALNLGAAHWIDNAQDQKDLTLAHLGALSMGIANVALSQLNTDEDTLRDLLEAMGRVTVLGVSGQKSEMERGRIWSRSEYYSSIAGKAAAIVATGIWLGGRLATDDTQTLTVLKEFGLALGMAIQLSDDCLDLAEDLSNGTCTLPVIEGLARANHPTHLELKELITRHSLSTTEVQRVISILENMGAITTCKRVIRAYQIQAASAFALFPNLEPYLGSYVTTET